MAGTQIQFRRGTTAQTNAFTGAAGEMTVDTDKNTLVVHNGVKAGGFPVARADAVGSSIVGLVGASNATTPTTKFDFTSADSVTTRSTDGTTKTYLAVGSLTVDLTFQGLGGRDQAGAFAAFAEPNIFYVPNGAGGLALVASLNAPSVGPTGYTEWRFAMSHKLNGGAQFYQGTLQQDRFVLSASTALVTNGGGVFPQTISTANAIPSIAKSWSIASEGSIVTSGAGAGGGDINLSNNSAIDLKFPVNVPLAASSAGFSLNGEFAPNAVRLMSYGYANLSTNVTSYVHTLRVRGWTSRI